MNKYMIESNKRIAAAIVAAAMAMTPMVASAGKPAPQRPTAAKADAKKAEPAAPAAAPAATPAAASAAPAATNAAMTEPTDAIITSGDNVVAVQPVFMVGERSEAAWFDLAASVVTRKASSAGIAEIGKLEVGAPKKVEGEANQFAGSSSAKDIRVLHQAIALGFIPALVVAGKTEAAKGLAAKLAGTMDSLEGLTKDTVDSAKIFIGLGMTDKEVEGKMIGMIFALAMKSGMQGIAEGPQRAHGYYIAGVWTGMSLMFASLGGQNDTFADLAEPICVLLDKDASFGGSDKTMAAHMRTIAAELRKETPDASVVRAQVEAILGLGDDEAKAAPKAP